MEISKLLEELKLANVEAIDEDGNTALHLTVYHVAFTQKDMIDSLQILLDRGINPDIENKHNETVLQLAVVYRIKDVVDFLISRKLNMDSVAHYFIEHEYKTFRSKLLTEENMTDELASNLRRIENESASYVEWLICKGFDFDHRVGKSQSPLDLAIYHNLQHILPALLKCTKKIHFSKGRNKTLLHSFLDDRLTLGLDSSLKKWYSDRYAVEIVKILLDKGLSPDAEDYDKSTPAQIAFKNGADIKVIQLLLERSTKIDHKNDKGESLLHIVMQSFVYSNESDREYHLGILHTIVAKGANVSELNKSDGFGHTALSHAIIQRNLQAIEFLQENGGNFSMISKNGENLLHLFVNRHLTVLKKKIDEDAEINLFNLLIKKGCLVKAKDGNGQTPLYRAVFQDNLAIARKLVEHGAEVNVKTLKTRDVMSPLQIAATIRYNLRMVEFLREHGADFSVTTENNENLLHLFVSRHADMEIDNDVEMALFHLLINEGCSINAKDVEGNTPLHSAVTFNNVAMVQKLLEHGAEVNCKKNNGMTPLQLAVAETHNVHVIASLGETGADFSVVTKRDENLLHLLIKRTNYLKTDDETKVKILNLLVSKGCLVNAKDARGNTPLHEAVICDNLVIIKKLIEHGAEVNCKKNNGMTLLQLAVAKMYNVHVIESLEAGGADFSVVTKDNENLLHLLIKRPDYLKTDDETEVKLLNLLTSKGCEVNAKDARGNTPLHEAVNHDSVVIIKKLIEHGAEVNCKTRDGETPLLIAAIKKYNACMVELLRENGADLNVTTKNGETLIHHLLKSSEFMKTGEESQVKLLNLIVSQGCQLGAKDETGTSLIHLAVLHFNVAIVRLLIERGVDVNSRNNRKETPLHLATMDSKLILDVANLLLEHGANVNAKDSQGQSALQKVAKQPKLYQSGDMVLVLLEYGADVNTKDVKGMTALEYARARDLEDYENERRDWIRNYQRNYFEDEYNDYLDDDDGLTPENYYEQVREWASLPVILLTQHSTRLKAANLPWDRKIEDWLGDFEMFADSDYSYEQHYENCLGEIEELKDTVIDNRVSLYDFLHMNPNSRCAYVNKEELQKFVQSLPKLEEQFPEYFVLILANYREASTRKSLLVSAKEAWLELTEIALPDLCLECIFSFLSNSDLFDMIEKD